MNRKKKHTMEGEKPEAGRPTDQDLLALGYLHKKITGQMQSCRVEFCDLTYPWELWKRFGGDDLVEAEDLYFFTAFKVGESTSRIRPMAAERKGRWHFEARSEFSATVEDQEKVKVEKAEYTFKHEASKEHLRWILNLYRLSPINTSLVLCRLRKNERKPRMRVPVPVTKIKVARLKSIITQNAAQVIPRRRSKRPNTSAKQQKMSSLTEIYQREEKLKINNKEDGPSAASKSLGCTSSGYNDFATNLSQQLLSVADNLDLQEKEVDLIPNTIHGKKGLMED